MNFVSFVSESGWREWLLRLPMPPSARAKVLRRFGSKVGSNVRVHPVTVMNAGWGNLVIMRDAYIGPDCILDLSAPLTIGDGAVLAAGVAVVTHTDAGSRHGSPTAERLGTYRRSVRIGEHAFVGARATVLADLGNDAVVGAGAVVVKPVPSGDIVAGVPATSLHP